MNIILYILLSTNLTLSQIKQNIRRNFDWIKDAQGEMEIKISLKDTSITQSMKFYMEKTEGGMRTKVEYGSERVMIKDNKFFFGNKSFSMPQISDTGKIFPEGKANINLKADKIELEFTPSDTASGILNYKFYIDKDNYTIKVTEITTSFGVIYTAFEYEKYNEGYFYKKIKTLSPDGTVMEILFKNMQINKGIPEKVWE